MVEQDFTCENPRASQSCFDVIHVGVPRYMGNIENTAVNELIARASGGPRATPAAGVTAMPPAMASESPPLALPRTMPIAAPFEPRAALPASYPVAMRAPAAPVAPPSASGPWQPLEPAAPPAGWSAAGGAWPQPLDPRQLFELSQRDPRDRERLVPTFRMRRPRSYVSLVIGRLVFPVALLVSIGLVVGAYVAFGGDHRRAAHEVAAGEPGHAAAAAISQAVAAAPVAPEAAAPAPAPEVAPPPPAPEAAAPTPPPAPEAAPTPAPPALEAAPPTPVAAATAPTSGAWLAAPSEAQAPASPPPPIVEPPPARAVPVLVDVRIDSIPSGAEVVLVDRGRTQLVGNTPIDTALDPSRAYDLVFTAQNLPPHVEHLDPRTTRRVQVTIGKRAGARPADSAPRRERRTPPRS